MGSNNMLDEDSEVCKQNLRSVKFTWKTINGENTKKNRLRNVSRKEKKQNFKNVKYKWKRERKQIK